MGITTRRGGINFRPIINRPASRETRRGNITPSPSPQPPLHACCWKALHDSCYMPAGPKGRVTGYRTPPELRPAPIA